MANSYTNYLICDYNGMLRSKIANDQYLGTVNFPQASLAAPSIKDMVVNDSGLSVVGEVLCCSDENSRHRSRWFDHLDFVMAALKTTDNDDWAYCSRNLLATMLNRYGSYSPPLAAFRL